MRMWLVDPKKLCRQHLLGEHLEMHMFASFINTGRSIKGFIDKGLVETDKIVERHNDLAKEMQRRGYTHKTPINMKDVVKQGFVDIQANEIELKKRCKECFNKMDKKEVTNEKICDTCKWSIYRTRYIVTSNRIEKHKVLTCILSNTVITEKYSCNKFDLLILPPVTL